MAGASWLLLIHQLPPKPPYLRVKVWRRLQALGAVPLKNSVYLLPATDESREDFEWVLREILKDGGEASLCEARLVEGLTDDEVRGLFLSAREADYRSLATDIRTLAHQNLASRARAISAATRADVETAVTRFRKRLAEIVHIDFFGAPGREAAEGLISGLEQRVSPNRAARAAAPLRTLTRAEVRKRTWVTRKGIHIDRIACGWLIRRFLDQDATFKFVAARGYAPGPGELRFDMFDAEFTHDGELCSFEVMLRDFALEDDPGLRAVAEIVHDIDLKESKFAREETPGVDHMIAGIAGLHADDTARLEHGTSVFEALYHYFQRRRNAERGT